MSARMNNAEVRLMTPLGWDISTVVSELREVREQSLADRQRTKQPPRLPSRKILIGILDRLSTALFPNRLGTSDLTSESVDYFVGHTLDATLRDLLEQVRRELQFSSGQTPIREQDRERAIEITYIRLRLGFVYLAAILDGYSRKVLAWRLSKTPWRLGSASTAWRRRCRSVSR